MVIKNDRFTSRHPVLFGLIIGAATICLAGIVVALNAFLGAWPSELSKEYAPGKASLFSKRFGLVRIEGIIMSSENLTDWINTLREDQNVPGVILRINSPGGAIAPSQEIFQAIKRLAQEKPVVASMGSVAASGGYYAAMPAHYIVANPGTLTGSIGVKMEFFQFAELMSKIGVHYEEFTSGPYKNAGNYFASLSPEQRSYLQGLINDMQEQFVQDLIDCRKVEPENARELADGRAFTGNQATKLNLIDAIGTMDDAKEALRERCGLPEIPPLLEMPKPPMPFLAQLMQGLADLKQDSLFPDNWRNLPAYLPANNALPHSKLNSY